MRAGATFTWVLHRTCMAGMKWQCPAPTSPLASSAQCRSLPPPNHNNTQLVREASSRVLGLRPFDVQLIGGMILHEGQIAEMRTGEGKTLVAVLPSFLNALSGASGWCLGDGLVAWWG